ncbi:MAG: Mrp/NBP35 family ATP-binding protein [bacterium]
MKTYKDLKEDGGSKIIEQVQAQAERVAHRLASVGRKVAVMSGKGGVGKSSVTVNLAAALALQNVRVGILDADLNGPSIARMTGVRSHDVTSGKAVMCPGESSLGIKVMSMDFFLARDDTPVTWDSPLPQQDAFTYQGFIETSTLRDLVSETEWGELDFLFFDLPPGAERLPNIEGALSGLDGTIVVTIPSEISQLSVKKSIAVVQKYLRTPIIGLVENMCGYVCPDCGTTQPLFPPGNGEQLAASYGIPYLGGIPFDPRWAECADAGVCYVHQYGDSPAGQAVKNIANRLINGL